MDSGHHLLGTLKMMEQAERYTDMYMLIMEEGMRMRNLLHEQELRRLWCVSWKNQLGALRAGWRIVSSVEQKERSRAEPLRAVWCGAYRQRLEGDLVQLCRNVLSVVNDMLGSANGGEERLHFLRMRMDLHRYIAECSGCSNSRRVADETLEELLEASQQDLRPTHPLRLSMALSYACFYYEILNQPDKACTLAKSAFDAAIAELDALSEDDYKEATLLMQMLRDNLTLWTAAEDPGPERSP
jgi:14-3-3 protein epsilon